MGICISLLYELTSWTGFKVPLFLLTSLSCPTIRNLLGSYLIEFFVLVPSSCLPLPCLSLFGIWDSAWGIRCHSCDNVVLFIPIHKLVWCFAFERSVFLIQSRLLPFYHMSFMFLYVFHLFLFPFRALLHFLDPEKFKSKDDFVQNYKNLSSFNENEVQFSILITYALTYPTCLCKYIFTCTQNIFWVILM